MGEFFHVEVGYNGCDISDIKTQFLVPAEDALWLSGIIYEGLKQQGYGGRFVKIIGQNRGVATLQRSTMESDNDSCSHDALKDKIILPVPFTEQKSQEEA